MRSAASSPRPTSLPSSTSPQWHLRRSTARAFSRRRRQREQLVHLRTGTDTARERVDNLIAFAAFLAKRGPLRLAWFDLCAAVEEALLPLTLRAQRKGVAPETEVAPELPLVHGDQERICDAIYHLADNAIKYTPPGGTVQVRCWADDGRACLDVQDTGVGIPADVLPTLWEAFAQAADPVRRGLEGLGLGLALVQYVVTEHGGEVHAESEVGVGSTFGFWLPCCGPEVAPVAGLDDTEAPGTVDTRSALAR